MWWWIFSLYWWWLTKEKRMMSAIVDTTLKLFPAGEVLHALLSNVNIVYLSIWVKTQPSSIVLLNDKIKIGIIFSLEINILATPFSFVTFANWKSAYIWVFPWQYHQSTILVLMKAIFLRVLKNKNKKSSLESLIFRCHVCVFKTHVRNKPNDSFCIQHLQIWSERCFRAANI